YLCFLRVLSAASATSPTCSPSERTLWAASVTLSRSILPRSMFFSDFGSWTLLSRFSGLRFWSRLFRATPPAIPARTTAACTPGPAALHARPTALPPALASVPFGCARREADALPRLDAVLLAFELLRRVLDRAVLDRALPDDPLLFVDFFILELPRDELPLEDRVVCAIVSRLSWLSVPAAPFAPAVYLHYPLSWGFELQFGACLKTVGFLRV